MSALTIFYLGVVVLTVVVAVAAVMIVKSGREDAGAPPADWGRDPDDRRWEDEAVDVLHSQLADVRGTATAWGAAISALLGIFSVVAFIKGPTAFTSVHGHEADAAALLILFAMVLAAGAVVLSALAAQGVPRDVQQLDGWELRFQSGARARAAVTQLAWSRLLAVASALVVVLSIGLTWLAALREGDGASATKVLVVTNGGGVRCGALVATSPVLKVKDAAGATMQVRGVKQIVKVESCP